MAKKFFTIAVDSIAVTAAKDLLRVSAPATGMVGLCELRISQDASETSEQLPFQVHRASNDGTGTAITPKPTDPGDTFGGTAVYNLSADTTLTDLMYREAVNVLNGLHWVASWEGSIIWTPPSGRLVVRLDAAPAASLNFNVWALMAELG